MTDQENKAPAPVALSVVARLRQTRFLDTLPDAIPTKWFQRDEGEFLPVEAATVDDIAFAVIMAHATHRAAYQRARDLEYLHRLAREAGALGTDLAVEAALKGVKEGVRK